jgi:prepilin-type N-terminal cleavage/methylation domain-containing protein
MRKALSKNLLNGFTLAEVLVVLCIIGIACLVIVPQIGNTDHMQVLSAGREVVSTFLYAQTMSITKGQNLNQNVFQVVFDPTLNRYEVQNSAGVVVPDPLSSGQPYRVNFSGGKRYRSITIESANFDGSHSVWFDRMGAPYSGTITTSPPPLNSGAVILRAGDTRVRVNVEPVSGRVSVTEL